MPCWFPLGLESLRGLRALIVDDNFTNRTIMLNQLARWEMSPLAVESGAKALEALEQAAATGQEFQLILLDAQMPEMDGFQFAERMAERPHAAKSTVLMLSSAEERRILTQVASFRDPPPGWTPLVQQGVVVSVKDRVLWMRIRPTAP